MAANQQPPTSASNPDCQYPVLDGTDHGMRVIAMLARSHTVPATFQVKGSGRNRRKFIRIALAQSGLMFLLLGSEIDHQGKFVPDESSDLGFYQITQVMDPKDLKKVNPEARQVLDHIRVHKCLPSLPDAGKPVVATPPKTGPRAGKPAAAMATAAPAMG